MEICEFILPSKNSANKSVSVNCAFGLIHKMTNIVTWVTVAARGEGGLALALHTLVPRRTQAEATWASLLFLSVFLLVICLQV